MLELTIIGNLGANAEIKEHNGKRFLAFSVAHTDKRMRDGQQVESTTWVRCTKAIGDNDRLSQYMTKGTKVYARGPFSVSTFQGKNGISAGIDCRVMQLELIGSSSQGQNQNSNFNLDINEPPF